MNLHTFRNKIALILSLPLVVFSLGAGPAPIGQINGTVPIHLQEFDLVSQTSGWILLNERLFWTTDSGRTWDEIGPSVPQAATVQDVDFIDFDNGWLLWMTINDDGSSRFTLTHTTDHGATWTSETLPLFEMGDVSAYSDEAGMGWLDAQNGWIRVKQSSSSNFSLGTLFTTSDGGNTWARSPLPVADQVTFSDFQTGWAVGGPTGAQVFKTQDGGGMWQTVTPNLSLNSAITAYPPFSSGEQDLLVMTSLDSQNNLTVHAFRDLSGAWSDIGQTTVNARSGNISLSILDAQNFVATIPGTESILQMRDGVFDMLINEDGLSSSINDLDMFSLDVGWAKSVDSNCVTASSIDGEAASVSCTSSTQLLFTGDGGLTWQKINLPSVVSKSALSSSAESNLSATVTSIPNLGNTEVLIGQGFDKCEIPTLAQLQTWMDSSPYRAVNLYIGGSSRACSNSALTSIYLETLHHQGWKFIPTWVGPQAPCTGYSSRMSSDATTAYNQGINEANLAVEKLADLGLTYPDKTGSVVYYDIEYYGTDTACRNAVNAFMNGWVSQIRTRGNLAGVYGSTLCNTGLSDFLTITNVPDVVWPARWYHNIYTGFYDPIATVWDLGSCIPNTVWADHQRIRQYEGDHNETWGGLTLEIDSNAIDGVVAVSVLDPAKISFQEIASGLSNPVFITNAGDGSGRIFILERSGRIRIFKNGILFPTPFLDIQSIVKSTGGEQGLLSLAFHPSYGSNGKFYVVYTAPRAGDSNGSILTLRQYSVSANPDVADSASGATILTIEHPDQSNHNGGTLAFGYGGYLYWSTGDGGGGGDPYDNGQNLASLLGKILRLDINSGSPYTVPASNPFYGSPNPNTKLIWAYGLRNPWRISFDRATHDLYIGDVGQSAREEVDFQSSTSGGGENYGWNIMEGSICYNASSCDKTGKILPAAEYDHSLGCSVTGGYVYRGSNFPSLAGQYLYGDYCSGRIFSIYGSSSGWSTPLQLADTAYNITTFGEDEQGELYLADYGTGKIYGIRYQEPFYSISGNTGVAGAMLGYIENGSKTITSDGSGDYTITVPYGWSGTVTPSKTGYSFSPVNRTYVNVVANQTAQNYTALVDISGNVGVAGVTLSYTDGTARTVMSLTNGSYSLPVSYNWSGTVTPTHVCFTFNPTNLPYSNVTIPQTAQDYTPTFNPASGCADVDILMGGANQGRFGIPSQGSTRQSFAGLNSGPVQMASTNGVPILAAQRILYYGNGVPTSFVEMMGLPDGQLDTTYWFPWYKNVVADGIDTQLRLGNVSGLPASVHVYIGGVEVSGSPFALTASGAGQSLRLSFAENNGPVKVVSDVPIVASERLLYYANGAWTSFSEMLGLPNSQLSKTYWFPWYKNVGDGIDTQLRLGVP